MENNSFYDKDLAKRFVSDYKLPISRISEDSFYYYLELYENEFNTLTKWDNLLKLIKNNFNSDAKLFLDEYYKKRDEIITFVENSVSYQLFNTMDMVAFSFKPKINVPKGNVYIENNIGKRFLSIDIKKANFQALKYVDTNIVLNADTYEDFIHKFTDLDYIADSKYTRQVIFGKLNPKRHITVEKYLINKIVELYSNNFNIGKIVNISNDEVIIELQKEYYINLKNLQEKIKRYVKINVTCEIFTLYGISLTGNDDKKRDMMYLKKIESPYTKEKYVCVPVNYYAIVYKKLHNIPLEEIDYHFTYEGLDCKFCEDFNVKLIEN